MKLKQKIKIEQLKISKYPHFIEECSKKSSQTLKTVFYYTRDSNAYLLKTEKKIKPIQVSFILVLNTLHPKNLRITKFLVFILF